MSKIKHGGLDQYGTGPFEQQQFGTAGVERVKLEHDTLMTSAAAFLLLQKANLCSFMPISHRRHGQDKTVLSCACRQCELNWRQDTTVLYGRYILHIID